MNVLVVNDDGIQAQGIYHLVQALAKEATVYVAAPHQQRSASGQSITMNVPIKMKEVEFENAEMALEITGTPADCVKLGLAELERRGICVDFVLSGINHGGNLGTDTHYSGTVGAAREACFSGKPAAAISVDDHNATHFELAATLAYQALKVLPSLDKKTILNINAPNIPISQLKGIKYPRLGLREYEDWFNVKSEEAMREAYTYDGAPVIYNSKDTDIDVIAAQEGYACVTPITWDYTDYKALANAGSWGFGINEKMEV